MQALIRSGLTLPASYRRWWLRFRRATNEADLIARTLTDFLMQQAVSSKKFNPWHLIDVGCGDAVLTANLVRLLLASGQQMPEGVDLIDPILQAASVQAFCEALPFSAVRSWSMDLGLFLRSHNEDQGSSSTPRLSLVIHSGYYITDFELDDVCLNHSSLGSLLVVNSARSFMGDIWALVNKPMYEELERIGSWSQSRGQLIGRIDASLRLPRSSDVSESREVLSFLALQEFEGLPSGTKRDMIDIVEKYRISEEEICFGLDFVYTPPRP